MDVLDRFYRGARQLGADPVVRITADCPLIDPEIIDRVIGAFLSASPEADFAANTLQRTYPRGLDVEVASFEALERIWREAREPHQRAHVFPYVYEHPERFVVVSVTDEQDRSWMRWTVDTEEDLAFARAVCQALGEREGASWREVLALLAREPGLVDINRHVQQKAATAP
jgi:spore coat polysaccharide biosynthesis protein SpsF